MTNETEFPVRTRAVIFDREGFLVYDALEFPERIFMTETSHP